MVWFQECFRGREKVQKTTKGCTRVCRSPSAVWGAVVLRQDTFHRTFTRVQGKVATLTCASSNLYFSRTPFCKQTPVCMRNTIFPRSWVLFSARGASMVGGFQPSFKAVIRRFSWSKKSAKTKKYLSNTLWHNVRPCTFEAIALILPKKLSSSKVW